MRDPQSDSEFEALIAAARPVLARHGLMIVRREEDAAAAAPVSPGPAPSPAPEAAVEFDESLDTTITAYSDQKRPYGLLLADRAGWLGTFSETALKAAKAAKASGAVVRVLLKHRGQYTNVVGIQPVPTDAPLAEPTPLYGGHPEDVPF